MEFFEEVRTNGVCTVTFGNLSISQKHPLQYRDTLETHGFPSLLHNRFGWVIIAGLGFGVKPILDSDIYRFDKYLLLHLPYGC